MDSENDSLPEEFPVCPRCGAGGPGVAFGKEGWVVVMDRVIPRVDEEGGYIDDTECVDYEVLWESYEPIIDGPYYCFQCHKRFNEFKIVGREEVVWKQMMESSKG